MAAEAAASPETAPSRPSQPKRPAPSKTRSTARPSLTSKSKAKGKSGRGQFGARVLKTATRVPRWVLFACACLIATLAGGFGYLLLAPQPTHAISVPGQLGGFVKSPTLDAATAQALRDKVVAGAAGEVKHVVAAVYEKTTGPGTSNGPQIFVFIGGNITGGGSAGNFIGGFITALHGSFNTSPGVLQGDAACAPGVNGGPAECAWADNDTFGVVVSATSSATALATEMRQMRPLVEHTVR